jgi:hypothetical protein
MRDLATELGFTEGLTQTPSGIRITADYFKDKWEEKAAVVMRLIAKKGDPTNKIKATSGQFGLLIRQRDNVDDEALVFLPKDEKSKMLSRGAKALGRMPS